MKATKPITTTTTEPTTYGVGDAVIIQPSAPIARLGIAGNPARGVIEYAVTDTAPHPTRGPLYHIRLTTPGAPGWLGFGVSRNYADELSHDDSPAHDGEHLGAFVFDLHNVKAGHSGLWVYPAAYSDAALCQGRADNLTESFGVPFHAVPLVRIDDETGWYAVTGASSTAALRRIVTRGMERARAMAPRTGDDAESEA